MEPAGGAFRCESSAQARETLRALGEAFPSLPPRRSVVDLEYLDSFDWRVHRRGGRMAAVRDGSGILIEWEPARGRSAYRCPVDRMPAFVWELPVGAFRDKLGDLLEMRRLLPVATIRLDIRLVAILDQRRKTVVRVRSESGTVRDPGNPDRRKRLRPVLRVLPVRGYSKEFRKVVAWVERRLGLRPAETCTMTRALETLGRVPTEKAKPGYDISPGMRCDAAMRVVLLSLLETMIRNENGTRADLDSEFLHDFRVAVRRTRSALGQVPALFPRRVVERFKREFAWLGTITSPVRDLDVQILEVKNRRHSGDDRPGLAQLEAWLQGRQQVVQADLARALGSARYRRLVASWREYLDRPGPRRSSLANATRPVEQVAAERIRSAHRRVLKKGGKIDDGSPPERLHRLRIECKKLRYLLEFFAGLFAKDEVRPLIDALKNLQDNLGAYNDLAVERDFLGRFLGRLSDESGRAAEEGRETVTDLIAGLHDRQAATRSAFRKKFGAFSGNEVTGRFRRLFGEPAP